MANYIGTATIGNITGDFIGNYASVGGAIYNYTLVGKANIGNITGDFIGNYITSDYSNGGAIYNEGGIIGNIMGNFIGNSVPSGSGGAIYNENGTIGDITGDFIGNYASYGVAICNFADAHTATIGNVTGDFIGNYASDGGGIIYNNGLYYGKASIGDITGDFIGNYADGGAIHNSQGTIGDITGDFIRNYASSDYSVSGVAVYNSSGPNYTASIGNIMGDFIGNHISSNGASGVAIFNHTQRGVAAIGNITGDFIGNKASSTGYDAEGGAIYNVNLGGVTAIGDITGDFIGNKASSARNNAEGGAIYNYTVSYTTSSIGNIIGNFIGNYANGSSSSSGGAIYNYADTHTATIGNITGDFISNYASSNNAEGGAIYTTQSMTFISDKGAHFFTSNYTQDSRGKIYNAIYVDSTSATMTFDTSGGGAWVINDNIEGGKYNFIGNDTINTEIATTTQYINMNNAIVNVKEVSVSNTTLRFGNYQHEDKTAKNWDGKGKFIASLNSDGTENLEADSVTSLTLNNAVFDISNGYLETVKLKKYSATDSFVHLDVDVENMKSDVINVKGDVDGVTKLVIHATSDKDIRGKGQILFAESFGDTKGGETSFEVARVYKSPYLYDVIYEGVENTSTPTVSKDNTWYFEMNRNDNPNEEDAPVDPNPDVPSVDDFVPTQPLEPIAPEVIGFEALQSAGLAQTNGMVYNIMRKVGVNRLFCPGCGFYDYNWDGEAFHNAWVDTTYNGLTIEAPVEIDAKVWGIEAGSDLQHDLNNKLGIFASYRQGNYEMNGKGEKYYSTIGSEIDIDSYLAGLYYRYDNNNWYAFATVYGGMQEAEIKTDDGISADTDGIEFGGSIEGGYNYALSRTLSVTPSLGVFYSQISYDDATDSAGKTVEYNDLKQVELEAGAKFAHTQYTDDGFYSLYVKPSVVQTLIDGDEINITEIGKVDTVEDKTLGRVEFGVNIGFNDNWSAYGWANYTFGSDYEATSLGAGLNYAW